MSNLIAICGQARSGKDTFAKILDYKILKFAQPLKDCLKVLFGFPDLEFQKDIKDPYWNVEPRKIMEYLGTEVAQYGFPTIMPDIKRDFFVKRFMLEHRDKLGVENLCITDLRFEHEAIALKQAYPEVKIVKILRPSLPIRDHPSDKEWQNIKADYTIINDGTLEEYEEKCLNLIQILNSQ